MGPAPNDFQISPITNVGSILPKVGTNLPGELKWKNLPKNHTQARSSSLFPTSDFSSLR